ncbi:MAG TPA: efflux RND transporter permease subunit, partial [Caulobacteraceae bacterium]
MNGIIRFSLQHRGLVAILMAVLFAAGAFGFSRLNIEAYPDPVPPLVEVVTQSPGQSAEEIERYITIPIEVQMAGVPHVTSVRTISLFGLSDVKVQFTYDFTHDEAEQRVINRLSQLGQLPGGAQPQLSPESPIGEIYRYRLAGPAGYSLTDLKTLQDWVLQRRFKAVPGVVDVTGWGGKTRTYDITVDDKRLVAYGATLPQVLQALNNANINVGGQTVNFGAQAAIVRGVGLIHSTGQIERTMLRSPGGTPVLLGDVAQVSVGNEPRLGIAGQDKDDDIVEGIVLMHRGDKSMPTIKAVEDEVARINASGLLPPGVHIEKIYDRRELIAVTTHTVLHNMIEGMVLIFLIQLLFLGNLRSALIVAATIPFALFFAVLIMLARGESANLLSVGAIDFGLVVDATVIMVETVFSALAHHPPIMRRSRPELPGKLGFIDRAAERVGKPIFFSAAIIIASFLPLFMLTGVEGHIFGPMAKTYAYAIAGGLIATFTITPALSALLLPGKVSETETRAVRWLRGLYQPVLEFALANRLVTLGGVGILGLTAIVAAGTLGMEFLPHLEEGNFWIRATLPPSISLEASASYVNRIRQVIGGFPEVQTVISQHGRPDDGTDATGFFNAEFFVPLKPFGTWPHHLTKAQLTEQLDKALVARFPGVDFNFSQNIQDNVEEAASGVKGENSVKLFGPDLEVLQATADKIKDVMAKVPGVTDLEVLDSLGQPTVRIDVDRARAARYGLSPGDVNATVQAAIGGQAAGALYEEGSDRNFPM